MSGFHPRSLRELLLGKIPLRLQRLQRTNTLVGYRVDIITRHLFTATTYHCSPIFSSLLCFLFFFCVLEKKRLYLCQASRVQECETTSNSLRDRFVALKAACLAPVKLCCSLHSCVCVILSCTLILTILHTSKHFKKSTPHKRASDHPSIAG